MKIAVIKTGGKQYKVAAGDKIQIEKISGNDGDKVKFDEVLLSGDDKKVEIGQPFIKDAKVEGKILKQFRDDKILVIKYKAKTRYTRRHGHRQHQTLVEIASV